MLSINAKHKKGISPIIAGIMLIAVALIAGLMVSTFSSTLVTKQTEKSPMCTLTTYYSIESAKYNLASGIIKIKITNRGKDDIYNFSIEADNGTVTTITPFTPSSTYKLKQGRSIYLKGYKSNLGNLNSIRVTPQSCPQKIAQLKVNNIDLTGNLVLNLHLDSVNTTNWTQDDSGNNNHGQLMNGSSSCYNQSGCINLTTGKYGSALQFDGTDDYVDLGNNLSGLPAEPTKITYEAWVYQQGYSTASNILGRTHLRFYSDHPSNGYLRFYMYVCNPAHTSCTEHWVTFTSSNPLNTWHHIVGTFDSSLPSDNIKTYYDGLLVFTETETKNQIYNSNQIVRVGGGEGFSSFNGTIDEVRIYNRALTADEIIELAS